MSNVTTGAFFSFSVRGFGVLDRTVHPGMGITTDSNVFAIAHEQVIVDGTVQPIIGLASISVLQVCPGVGENNQRMDGAISVRINVFFDRDLEIRVCLVIFP
jgi:hypothetical protein